MPLTPSQLARADRLRERGRAIGRGVGHAGNLADRAALHAWDATKAIVRPGKFETSGPVKDFLLGTPWGRRIALTAVLAPALVAASEDPIRRTFDDATLQGQHNMMKLNNDRTKTAGPRWDAIKQFFSVGGPLRQAGAGMGKAMGGVKIDPTDIQRHVGPHAVGPQLAGAAAGKSIVSPLLAAGLGGAGIGAVVSQPENTLGYQLSKGLMGNNLWDRVQGDEVLLESFLKSLGSEAASGVSGLAQMGAQAGAGALQQGVLQGPKQRKVLGGLMDDDDILSRASPEDLQQAYQTLQMFAPTLATDPNAVRSFLREAATTGGGVDYASIANLSRAEQTVNPMYKRSSLNERGDSVASKVDLTKLMSCDALDRIKSSGLHKLAAKKLEQEGINVGDTLDLKKTAYVLGRKLREKNARSLHIVAGLKALKALN